MKAKAFLLQVRKLDCMIANKRDEREQWRMLATSTTSGAAPETGVKVQSSGSQQKMADAVDRSIDIGAEISATITRLFQARQQIVSVIEQLPVAEYDLLHAMYIGRVEHDKKTGDRIVYKTLAEAAEEADKSESWARSMHGRALANVQRLIDAQQIEPVAVMIKRWNAEKC